MSYLCECRADNLCDFHRNWSSNDRRVAGDWYVAGAHVYTAAGIEAPATPGVIAQMRNRLVALHRLIGLEIPKALLD